MADAAVAEKRPASAEPSAELSKEERRKKRKSRWAGEDEKVDLPGIITSLPSSLTKDQQECYLSMAFSSIVEILIFSFSGQFVLTSLRCILDCFNSLCNSSKLFWAWS